MKIEKIETEKGILKYRSPNVLETYDLLNKSGVSDGVTDVYLVKRNILAAIGDLFIFDEIEEYKSYQDLIDDADFSMEYLNAIADIITTKIFMVFRKKNLSEMQSQP